MPQPVSLFKKGLWCRSFPHRTPFLTPFFTFSYRTPPVAASAWCNEGSQWWEMGTEKSWFEKTETATGGVKNVGLKKFRKCHRKTPELESLFNKDANKSNY